MTDQNSLLADRLMRLSADSPIVADANRRARQANPAAVRQCVAPTIVKSSEV